MPLKRILDENRSFDPEAVAVLLGAYDGMVSELKLRTIEEKESAARLVLQIALDQTDLDAPSLRDKAVAVRRSENSFVRYALPETPIPTR